MTPAETFVVDASVAVKWHLTDEENSVEAAVLLARFSENQVELIAPDHIRSEVPNAIAVATLGQTPRLTEEQGREAIEEFLSLGVPTVGGDQLVRDAYPLVHRYGLAFYDALYVALAQQLSASLITADRALYQRTRPLPWIVWIGDYAGSS